MTGPERAGSGPRPPTSRRDTSGIGPALRRAWIGYQRRIDEAMAATGFDGRGFPDGRVLRMCRGSEAPTISDIGRHLGITRQGASRLVGKLRDRGYVSVRPSTTSGREKVVELTSRADDYLAAQHRAARRIERELRAELGPEALASLGRLLDGLGEEDPRSGEHLRATGEGSRGGAPGRHG